MASQDHSDIRIGFDMVVEIESCATFGILTQSACDKVNLTMQPPIKVFSSIGTRPEAIKMAPLLVRMKKQPEIFTSVVCATGQHCQMLDQALGVFQIQVDYNLNVMTDDQSLTELTVRIIKGVDEIISTVQPDIVFVQGDTTTTLAGALAAFYNNVPIAHIEAGLRTWDMKNPFPEEANRVLTDKLCSYFFAPTELNRKNLLREGVEPSRIFVTGNTGIDALLMVRDRIKGVNPEIWRNCWGTATEAIIGNTHPLVLITAHRRENFGEGLQSILELIKDFAKDYPDWNFVYPVHLNPNVQRASNRTLAGIRNIYLIPPLDYEPFVYLMNRCYMILTDSGGIQEEAPSLRKPVIVTRQKTERPEAAEAGNVIVAGTDKHNIRKAIKNLIENPDRLHEISSRPNPYGDGFASKRILDLICQKLGKS
jgi:UDP-N-acetylglucosamine 2-epimerase (non-hydrolysing)